MVSSVSIITRENHLNHEIRYVEKFGRCIFSNRDIVKGEIIAVCELLVLDVRDTVLVNETGLKHYTFKYSHTKDCLVLGIGELFNHDTAANVEYKLEKYGSTAGTQAQKNGDRMVMVFTASVDVPSDTQLFIDYEADCTKAAAKDYVATKSLIG